MHRPAAAGLSIALVATLALPMALAPDGASAFPGQPTYVIVPLVPDTAEVKGAEDLRPAAPPYAPPGLAGPSAPLGQGYVVESEPNNTFGTADPLGGSNVVAWGNIFPNADVDWWSFTAAAGDRVYAATMTSFSANSSTDSQLRLFQSDGTTLIEFDDDDGTIGGLSSSIAGASIPAAGTYFLEVRHFSATNQLRPYELHFRLQSGAPTPEVEPNDTPATANPLPASGWVSGTRNPAAGTEQDWYSFTANAGDTVFLSLDLDPERDGVSWNGRLGIALFGDATNQILVVDDGGTVDVIDSEALFMTVKNTGTYFAFVDSASAATGGPTATYHLSVSIHPATDEGVNCTTYTSTDVPVAIGPGAGLVSSTITVPGNPRIADLDVAIVLNHAQMADLDVSLRSPAGNVNSLFTDIGATAAGGQTQMDTVFDDEAAMPPLFTVLRGPSFKPELAYRLSWFDGEDAGGTWTLDLRDDVTNASGGTLTAWSLRICEPPPPPACAPGFAPLVVYSSDFEANDGGFTHSGAQDEWERGLPSFAPITTCNSGTNCWVTDLDNTYNASSNQDLLSPNINLAGLSAPVVVRWAQRYQMENATFDHYSVDIRQVGPVNPSRLFEWLDATMTDLVGNPTVTLQQSAGWGLFERRADAYAGQNVELLFHLDSDTTVQLAGVAIDDVSVTACRPLSADLSITKTDGSATEIPGTPVTYTITASNAGPDGVTGATVADTFPGILSGCSTTCVGAGGGTCTAGPFAGNINDLVNLPAGGSVTYTSTCNISPAATGTLVNTATVASAVADPTPGNNSATDTDTLTPQGDLSITKTDGSATEIPGTPVTYTITAANSGPSNAVGATVADTFPGILSGCSTTCVGAGGGTCTAGPFAGNISDVVNLPAGGSVTYTSTCNISPAATGALVNTATVTAPGGFTDTAPGNNSATDTDTLTPQGDLAITKTDGLATATAGQAIVYTLVASNPGPSNVTGATVADTFPAALTGISWTCVGAGGGTCTAGPVGGNINDLVNLPAGGSATYTVNATISAAFSGTLSNTATITAPGGFTDPNGGNNSATDTTEVSGLAADVSGTKTVGGDFQVGGLVTYTIVLTNAGPGIQGDNPGDEFTDTLPATLALVSAAASSGTVGTAGNTVTWNGAIPVAGSVTIVIDATILPAAAGQTVSNQGTISYDGDGNGTNEATRLTDDPGVAGADDPTRFFVSLSLIEIPTLTTWGFAAFAGLLALVALAGLARRRRAA